MQMALLVIRSTDDDTWWMVLDGFSLSKKKVYFYLYFPKLFL